MWSGPVRLHCTLSFIQFHPYFPIPILYQDFWYPPQLQYEVGNCIIYLPNVHVLHVNKMAGMIENYSKSEFCMVVRILQAEEWLRVRFTAGLLQAQKESLWLRNICIHPLQGTENWVICKE
jgi:hypothetical protein